MTVTCNETTQQMDMDSEEDDIPNEIIKEVENFENKPKSNLDETEVVNLGDAENIKETQISIHLSSSEKKEYTEFLKEYEDIFAWSYDDMTGQKLRHYACAYPTYLISRMDPLKYIFQKPMPIGKLDKWKIMFNEFDIIYVTEKVVKGHALVDHLAENPMNGGYEPLKTYFLDEEVSFKGEDIAESYDGWIMLFNGATNFKGVGIGAVLISETDKNFIDTISVKIHNQPAYYAYVEEEVDGKPWFHDIKEYLAKEEYRELANPTQKRTLRRLSNNFFQAGGILYRRTPNLGLLKFVDAKEASKLLEEIHAGTCGTHMNGFVLAKKILRAG
ncbi:uncharacterized protein [Nicotiana sylvestris]|uniref:uncharacterized protein n=1 Tax=Nicotiana sylvestris TaxID=4096 RepID=UPI00388C7B3E